MKYEPPESCTIDRGFFVLCRHEVLASDVTIHDLDTGQTAQREVKHGVDQFGATVAYVDLKETR